MNAVTALWRNWKLLTRGLTAFGSLGWRAARNYPNTTSQHRCRMLMQRDVALAEVEFFDLLLEVLAVDA